MGTDIALLSARAKGVRAMRLGWATLNFTCSLLFLILCVPATPASAGATYTWVPLTAVGNVNGNPVGLFSLGSISFASAHSGNHFSFFGTCSGGPAFLCAPGFSTGDFGSFAIQPAGFGGMKPIVLVSIDVIFNEDGTLTGFTNYNDTGADFFLGGTANAWSGHFNSDLINCNNPNPCQATGYWKTSGPIPAPEPSTWALLLAGMGSLGFAWVLRRRPAPGRH